MPRTLSRDEYEAVKQHVLEQAPAGLSQQDFERSVRPVLDGAVAEAENSPEPVSGGSFGRFVSGAWSVLNPVSMATGVYNAVRHPVDTAIAVGQSQLGQFKQAGDLASQGRYIEAAGHAGAGVLPLIGPAAASAGEQIAAGDVAGGLGKGAGLLAPFAAKPALAAAVAAAPETAARLSTALESGAARRVTDVMSPKVGANKTRFGNMAEKVAPQVVQDLAEHGAPLSREGLHSQMAASLSDAEQALDAASDARNSTKAFPTKPAIDALLKKRATLTAEAIDASQTPRTAVQRPSPILDANGQPMTATDLKTTPIGADVVPSPNEARVAVIDKAIAELKQLGDVARYEPLRVMRQSYDGPAKAVYSPAVTADYMKAQGGKLGAADVTGVLREELAKQDPVTATANAKYSVYRTANDVLDATAEVERTRPKVGRQIIARMAGSILGQKAAGLPGAAAGYVAGPIVDSALSSGVTTQLKTAALMKTLADAIRRNDLAKVYTVTSQIKALAPAAARAVGRATSPSESQTNTAAATSP